MGWSSVHAPAQDTGSGAPSVVADPPESAPRSSIWVRSSHVDFIEMGGAGGLRFPVFLGTESRGGENGIRGKQPSGSQVSDSRDSIDHPHSPPEALSEGSVDREFQSAL